MGVQLWNLRPAKSTSLTTCSIDCSGCMGQGPEGGVCESDSQEMDYYNCLS